MTDSVEARDVIAHTLAEQFGPALTARINTSTTSVLAALSEAGYSVIRTDPSLTQLLHEIDGQLGLLVYRDDHSDEWKLEAHALIRRIRAALIVLRGDSHE